MGAIFSDKGCTGSVLVLLLHLSCIIDAWITLLKPVCKKHSVLYLFKKCSIVADSNNMNGPLCKMQKVFKVSSVHKPSYSITDHFIGQILCWANLQSQMHWGELYMLIGPYCQLSCWLFNKNCKLIYNNKSAAASAYALHKKVFHPPHLSISKTCLATSYKI